MNKFRRCRLFVDKEVQTGILKRIVIYWLFSVLFITLPVAFVYTIFDSSRLWITHYVDVWKQHWPLFATMTLMVPFAFYDFLKYSNRFVGPIYRLRTELKRIDTTGELRSIKFRDKDFWSDLATGFSRLTLRISELEKKLAKYESQSESNKSAVS